MSTTPEDAHARPGSFLLAASSWQLPLGSFLLLLKVHERLAEQFLAHQEALLDLGVGTARRRLDRYTATISEHMRLEEELLIPVYRRAGPIPGGGVDLFLGEHRKMQEFLGRFSPALERLAAPPSVPRRDVIRLLDEEATYKHLAEHHDLRERRILYPTLDGVTEEREREDLLLLCRVR